MWSTGALVNLNQRAQAGVITEFVIEARDLSVINICDNFKLSRSGVQATYGFVHGIGNNTPGFAHVNQFRFGFYQARPVNNFVIVGNSRIG